MMTANFSMHGQPSVLAQLLADERVRLPSQEWLIRWFGADVDGKWPGATDESETVQKILASFRRTLRNFVDGRPLGDGASWKAAQVADEPFVEDVMRCYIVILCRQAALEPQWLAGYQRFSSDSVVLLKPAREEMRPGLCEWNDCRQMVLDAVAGFHANLVSGRETSSYWPHMHELPLVSVIPPATKTNFRKKKYFPSLDNVQEFLFPALSALRHFNHGADFHRELLLKHDLAQENGNAYRQLIGEDWRFQDGARQLMFRLFAMVCERVLWLARNTADERLGSRPHFVEIDLIGRSMDEEIKSGRIGLTRQASVLDHRVDGRLKAMAATSPRAPAAGLHPRMPMRPPALSDDYGQLSALVEIEPQVPGVLRLNIAEAEMPEGVGWYEMQLAWVEDRNGILEFTVWEPEMLGIGAVSQVGWISHHLAWPQNEPPPVRVVASYRLLEGGGAMLLIGLHR